MRLIDTHTHIYQPDFDEEIHTVISRAQEAGLQKILLPNIDLDSIDRMYRLCEKYPDYCLPMMGLHPTSVNEYWQETLQQMKPYFCSHRNIAVGEIGIDLYWDTTYAVQQRLAFEEQLHWSIEFDLPVSIHTRNAISETIKSIKNVGENKLRGIFHSFGGTVEELKSILKLDNFYLGINGVVTYKNSKLCEVLKNTDLSRIVIETDAPYLTPVPHRGKRNEPAYCVYIAQKLAEIYEVSIEEVGQITTQNAKNLFGV